MESTGFLPLCPCLARTGSQRGWSLRGVKCSGTVCGSWHVCMQTQCESVCQRQGGNEGREENRGWGFEGGVSPSVVSGKRF